jgi:sigma-B regulation protein RsbQ
MADILRRNNVRIFGRGARTIVFAHGFGCDQNMWRFLTPAFENDYRIVLFDYVGSGKSDVTAFNPVRYSTLHGYADDLLDVCAAADVENAIFVGHSVSSMVGVLAANRDPRRFAHLVLVGPSPRYINDEDYAGGFERADIEGLLDLMDRNFIGWANFLAPVVMGNPDRPELQEELNESFCSTDPKIARRFAETTFLSDNRADLAKCTTPSLILQCSEDAIAPPEVGRYVARTLPRNTFRQLKATGHCPHVSHPDETIAAIREYLASIDE